MDLAERVIQANEAKINEDEIVEKDDGDGAPEGYYTDDLGLWVQLDIRRHRHKFAEYVIFRCRLLNNDLNIRNSTTLCKGHKVITDSPKDIASLADLPENISRGTAAWVYKRLYLEAPYLDRRKMEINHGWVWDLDKQDIIRV